MRFMEAYKRLEKLCGEIYGRERPVSAYIDAMECVSAGQLYVASWQADLCQLKRYRGVRNSIAHDPGCNEEDMCSRDDVVWLESFYQRIIYQTDPLSLYRKATIKTQKDDASQQYARKARTKLMEQKYSKGAALLKVRKQKRNKPVSKESAAACVAVIVATIVILLLLLDISGLL